jgi:hypothetical protein
MSCAVLPIVAAASFVSMLIAVSVGIRLAARIDALERQLERDPAIPAWRINHETPTRGGGRVKGV